MKTSKRLLISLVASLNILAITPAALAVEASTGTSNQGSAKVASDKDETAEQEIKRLFEAESKKKDKAERLKGRVAEFKVKLTADEQTRLKARCTSAQAKVKTVESNVDKGVNNRISAYEALLDRLDKLTVKLKEKSIDTTKLEQQRAALEVTIEKFKTDLAAYKVTLDDLKGLGCTEDPAAFKAALEAARAARLVVKNDAAAVRTYVQDTIKPTLKELKVEWSKAQANDSDNSTSTEEQTTTGGGQ